MKLYFAIITILFHIKIIFGQSSGQCMTPFNEAGICVAIKDCTTIWRIVTTAQRPLSERVLQFLKNSVCDDPALRKVCCRNQDVAQGVQVPALVSTNPAVGNNEILNHVNLRHLDAKNCGPLSSDRIAYGNETLLFEFPWMALLQYEDQSELDFKCGGSVINKRFILTAAHCVSNLRRGTRLVSVRLGEYDISQNIDCQVQDGERVCAPAVQDIPIDRTIAHPGFNNPRYANDIALVKLSRDADFRDFSVRPICLPITNELINLPLKTLIVTGWGTTETERRSDILLKANVPYVQNQPCESALKVKLTPGQFCAGGEGLVDSCRGDSGGPLQFIARLKGTKVVQFGVISFGVSGCGENEAKPGVYANIRYYMKWILDNIDAA